VGSRMFGLRLPLASEDDTKTTTELDLNDPDTAKAYGKHPRQPGEYGQPGVSPFGNGYADCKPGKFPQHNGETDVTYIVKDGKYISLNAAEVPAYNNVAPGFQQNCNEMTPFNDAEYSLKLQSQWDHFHSGLDSYTTSDLPGPAWHPKVAEKFKGGVLYLSEKAEEVLRADDKSKSALHDGLPFDCTEVPVPGEKKLCSKTDILRYPFRQCWVDTYRSDSLRAVVPYCDISVTVDNVIKETVSVSHASFYGPTGCKGTDKTELKTSCAADEDVTTWHTDSNAFGYTHTSYKHDGNSIIGKCCQAQTSFFEAFPNVKEATSEYECENRYMFTHAEREAAFGSKDTLGNNYDDDVVEDLPGFNTNDADSSLGYWYKNQGYAKEFTPDSGPVKTANLKTENAWSISSDIQGVYKVVASTDVLGTVCSLRAKGSKSTDLVPADMKQKVAL